jgi:hypothetical protein
VPARPPNGPSAEANSPTTSPTSAPNTAAAARENPGGDAVKGAAEIIGVNGRFVGHPIAIGILK